MEMGRGEEGVKCMESNMETYITICKIDSQREFAVWLRKLKEGLCINLEGWDWVGHGRRCKRKGIYVSFSILVSSESRSGMLRSGIAGSYSGFIPSF